MTDGYNYAHFPQDLDGPLFNAFPQKLRVGMAAPDGELTRLDDAARVRASLSVLEVRSCGHRVWFHHLTVLRAGGAGPGAPGGALCRSGLHVPVRVHARGSPR